MPTYQRGRIGEARVTDSRVSDWVERRITDSATGTELIDTPWKTVSDSAQGTEELTISKTQTVDFPRIAESRITRTAIGFTAELSKSIFDSAVGSEVIGIGKTFTIADQTALETRPPRVSQSRISETAIVKFFEREAIQITVQPPNITDSATGSDAVLVAQAFFVSDSAIGNEVLDIIRFINISDSSIGSDIIVATGLRVHVPDSKTGQTAFAVYFEEESSDE